MRGGARRGSESAMRRDLRVIRLLLCAGALAAALLTSGAAVRPPQAAGGHPARAGHGPRRAASHPASASPTGTGASDITDLGASGWEVLSSASTSATGAQISAPGFSTAGWLPVSNDDAGAPGTEIEALVQNGRCPGDPALQPVNQGTSSTSSVFFSNNMQLCYGYMNKIGSDSLSLFDVAWWWRTAFTPDLAPGQTATLIINGAVGSASVWVNGTEVATPAPVTGDYTRFTFDITPDRAPGQTATLIINGVVGSASVWVNGTEVATPATVTGDYTRFTFDITPLIVSGTNSLAIEVNPNDPTSMYTLDNVDWTQIPPDNMTGIQFPVQLQVDGALAVGNSHVNQSDAADLSSAALTVKTDVTNYTSVSQAATVTATITPPGGGTPITDSQPVTVPADATQTVTFAPSGYPNLTIANPQVWWPYQLGAQPLYTLGVTVSQGSTQYNSTTGTFGIRTVTSYL